MGSFRGVKGPENFEQMHQFFDTAASRASFLHRWLRAGCARVSRGLAKLGVHRVHRVVCFSCNAKRNFWLEGGAKISIRLRRFLAKARLSLLCAALRGAARRGAALRLSLSSYTFG